MTSALRHDSYCKSRATGDGRRAFEASFEDLNLRLLMADEAEPELALDVVGGCVSTLFGGELAIGAHLLAADDTTRATIRDQAQWP